MRLIKKDEKLKFPESIKEHIKDGCRVAIIVFYDKHLKIAEKYASKDRYGNPLAFSLEKSELDFNEHAKCSMNCLCHVTGESLDVRGALSNFLNPPQLQGLCGKYIYA